MILHQKRCTVFQSADSLFPFLPEFTNKPVMGYRETIKIHKEEKEIKRMVEGVEKTGK